MSKYSMPLLDELLIIFNEIKSSSPFTSVANDMQLKGDLKFDSLDKAFLYFKVAKKFNIKLTPQQAVSWITVADVVKTIENAN